MKKRPEIDRIRLIIDTLRKASKGDYALRIAASSGNDELDSLVAAVNEVLDVVCERVTASGQALDALRKSEERYRRITRGVTDYIYTVRFEGGRAVETRHSEGCVAITGYSADELSADPYLWYRMVMEEDRAAVEGQARCLALGENAPPMEHRIVRKDGEMRWIRNTQVPHRDAEGRLLSYDGVIKDITERKHAEEEKAKLELQLQQAQKMESVGRLAGGVAHEFNNMLTVILGYTEMIISGLPAGDPLRKPLQEIDRAAKYSRDITHQLLAFSRKQIISPQYTNLNHLIASTKNTHARLIGEDIELRFSAGTHLWTIVVDPSQLDQILINLAVNARDAMPHGGVLSIRTANLSLNAAFCREHVGIAPGDHVLLEVRDNGVGMDREILSHIFEPFFTTKEKGRGTGLGLATVYGIVKQNGGFIYVYSEAGHGTLFEIYFPRAAKQGEEPLQSAETPIARGEGTVLLVEDDEMVRKITAAMLESIGYNVLTTATPEDALSVCEKKDTPIDLLITDVVMPGVSGAELRDRIEAVRPGIRALFISGYTSDVVVHRGVREEGVNFLQKPFSREDLAHKIRQMMI